MSTKLLAAGTHRHAVADTLALIEELLGPQEGWRAALRLWDGTRVGPPDAPATVVLRHPWSLRAMLWPPDDLTLGEAFIYGDVDVEGDLESALMALLPAAEIQWREPRRFARLMRLLLRLPAAPPRTDSRRATLDGEPHSKRRDRESVRHHYDVSNEFYRLWLDPRMQYSCAYFERPDLSLEAAQNAKVEHICRKLRLRPGDRVLDIGCGWGGLLEYATRRDGVSGHGITLSPPQAEEANRRFASAGIDHLTRAEVRDYREIDERYDAIASVGMVEHVGVARLHEYFERAMSLLRPGGVFLLQSITTSSVGYGAGRGSSFIRNYVFPDGELATISTLTAEAEQAGFEVRDVENLREHYAATLRHWVQNLVAHRDEAIALTDEVTFRVWWLYMTACAISFQRGLIGVYQVLLARPTGEATGAPLTRADWYARPAGAHFES